MSYKVVAIENFRKEAKRLIKKYASLQKELEDLGQQLSENPALGTPLGNSCYKIRLSIASKGKGEIRWRQGYYIGFCFWQYCFPPFYLRQI